MVLKWDSQMSIINILSSYTCRNTRYYKYGSTLKKTNTRSESLSKDQLSYSVYVTTYWTYGLLLSSENEREHNPNEMPSGRRYHTL